MLIDPDKVGLFKLCGNLSVNSSGYAVWRVRWQGTMRGFLAHRMVLGLDAFDVDPRFVDHINGDKLDNRRANLRICSAQENSRNVRVQRGRRFKGVYPNGRGWQAKIVVDKRTRCLGTYKSQEEAARAYDTAARQFFGEFAAPNFPA